METYKTNLLSILYTKYYTGYTGGPLEYLDNWEAAAIQFDNITPKEKTSSKAKRTNFGAHFTVINDTYFLLEQVRDTTNTWDEMCDSLRTKLARRMEHEKRSSSKHARINNLFGIQSTNTNVHDEEEMNDIKFYINATQRFSRN